jgi:hypothetical protein
MGGNNVYKACKGLYRVTSRRAMMISGFMPNHRLQINAA